MLHDDGAYEEGYTNAEETGVNDTSEETRE